MAISAKKRQFGDFQTPDSLAQQVTDLLKQNYKISPQIILEPTCGTGAFIRAALQTFPTSEIVGQEINPNYIQEAQQSIANHPQGHQVSLNQGDFFATDWQALMSKFSRNILILGNPPWVTSSELSLLNSQNLPSKSNHQNRRGIEAITGSANFDISEWMLLQFTQWLPHQTGTLAILCKYSVARKVFCQVKNNDTAPFMAHIYLIDAKSYFNVAVAACLFVFRYESSGGFDCHLYPTLDSQIPSESIGERDGILVRNTVQYDRWRHLLGQNLNYTWRSGIKHDCSKIMELAPVGDGKFRNGIGEIYDLEPTYIYPLLKSSDIGNGRIETYRKMVLVTQRAVGQDTHSIQKNAPKTWQYLSDHNQILSRRKSSIYKNKPPYSVFGIGAYSFKPWKIAISGFYKHLNFQLISPLNNKPVMVDDTVNFLSFDSQAEAQFILKLVTSKPAQECLTSMLFWDEKRPITIDILRRLSLQAVARELGCLELYTDWVKAIQVNSQGQLELGLF
ncbi:MAG: Methyltransferase domain [Phormidium sp. OSCR]|nr:MAG: Methyltransferase domain [Phormidium sp. OSCR]